MKSGNGNSFLAAENSMARLANLKCESAKKMETPRKVAKIVDVDLGDLHRNDDRRTPWPM